jgi:hypothetical protein
MSTVATTPSTEALLDAPAARIGPRSLASHTLTITRRNLLQVRNNPRLLVFIAIQPILFVLLFVYVFGGAISSSSRDYVQFVILGIITQTVVFGTVMTGIGLSEDLARGIIDRFRSLQIGRSAVLTGRILADGARTAAAVLITTAVGVLLGFRLAGGPVAALGAFALAVAFGTAFAWIAATIGLTVRNPEAPPGTHPRPRRASRRTGGGPRPLQHRPAARRDRLCHPDDEHSGRGAQIRKARRQGLALARRRRIAYHRKHGKETRP